MAPAPAVEAGGPAAREAGSPRPIFIAVAIIFVVTFAASAFIVVRLLNGKTVPDAEVSTVHPPLSFELTRLQTRLDRLQYELEDSPDSPERTRGLEEMKVLRVRLETTGAPEDVDRLNGAIDEWEHTYVTAR